MAQFHTTERLGNVQRLTREGFLVCENVPVSRTGTLLYAPGELPIPPGPDGLVRVHRSEDEVFAPNALASFEGKSVVDLHPGVDVTPANWRLHAVGHMQNVRRGTDAQSEHVVADLVIKDAAAIREVRAGKRHVSLGYDADYQVISPGYANQRNIIGNHCALVPQGRCGPTCSIGDASMTTLFDKFRAAWQTKDDSLYAEAMASEAGTGTAAGSQPVIHIHNTTATSDKSGTPPAGKEDASMEKEFMTKTSDALTLMSETVKGLGEKFAKVETDLKDLVTKEEARETAKAADAVAKAAADAAAAAETARKAKEEDDKTKATKTGDSAGLATAFQDAIARAEMLIPGVRVPTFDATATPDVTTNGLCAFKRSVLASAALVPGKAADHVAAVSPQNPDFAAMTCDQVGSIFQGASELARAGNNSGTRPGFLAPVGSAGFKGPPTAAEMNARNREYYGKK